jgi:hypothetical protein
MDWNLDVEEKSEERIINEKKQKERKRKVVRKSWRGKEDDKK